MAAIAFELSEEVRAVRDGVARFVDSVVVPLHERHRDLLADDRRMYLPDGRYAPEVNALKRAVRTASAEAGFYQMCAPPEIGGAGLGMVPYFVCWEEIFRRCGAHHWLGWQTIAGWTRGPSPVLQRMTAQARERILPDMIAGRTTMCFGMSEPGGGSDVQGMKTRAAADGDGWRLNGRKIWTTNTPPPTTSSSSP